MTFNQETRLGRTINQLRRSTDDPEVQKKAKRLLKSWQKFLKPLAPGTPAAADPGALPPTNTAGGVAVASCPISSPAPAAARQPPVINGVRNHHHHHHHQLDHSTPSSVSSPAASPSPPIKLRPLPPSDLKALPSILKRSSTLKEAGNITNGDGKSGAICDNDKTTLKEKEGADIVLPAASSSAPSPEPSLPSSSTVSPAKKRVRFVCEEKVEGSAAKAKIATSPPQQSGKDEPSSLAQLAVQSGGGNLCRIDFLHFRECL